MIEFWKRWGPDTPTKPTEEEKQKAESFKQILKYGEDIGKMYKDVSSRLDVIFKEKREIKEICEKRIIKQLGIKFKDGGIKRNDWNSIFIREYSDCEKSPLGACITMIEFGGDNPNKEDPQYCFYCNKEFKK